jgi:4'-phosphopantetheinyl transferase
MSRSRMMGGEQVHLWVLDPTQLDTSGHLSKYVGIISPAERARMERFHFQRDRMAFLAAHGLVREALSQFVPSVPPSLWEFRQTEKGRPEIAAPRLGTALRFNISHTRGLVACLVSLKVDCGVDVDTLDRVVNIARLAGKVLSPTERSQLLSVPAYRQNELFFSYWTLKEAYAKARGCGMHMPFHKCAFEFSSEGILAHFDASLNDEEKEWQFAQWSPTEKHLVAVALRRPRAAVCRIIYHRSPPG